MKQELREYHFALLDGTHITIKESEYALACKKLHKELGIVCLMRLN